MKQTLEFLHPIDGDVLFSVADGVVEERRVACRGGGICSARAQDSNQRSSGHRKGRCLYRKSFSGRLPQCGRSGRYQKPEKRRQFTSTGSETDTGPIALGWMTSSVVWKISTDIKIGVYLYF